MKIIISAFRLQISIFVHLLTWSDECEFPRKFMTLKVVQFILKIAHLTISMEPRRCRACSLPDSNQIVAPVQDRKIPWVIC